MLTRVRALSRTLVTILSIAASGTTMGAVRTSPGGSAMVRIPGHVLSAPASAKRVDSVKESAAAGQALTLTIVLKRDEQKEFDRYLSEIYNPHSVHYRKYLTPKQVSDRFGPTQHEYESLISYLSANGLRLINGSSNRLTITMRGSRAQVERATHTKIRDYRFGNATFYANQNDPSLPDDLASHVASIEGLSNLAHPHRVFNFDPIKNCTDENTKYYAGNRDKAEYVCRNGSTTGYNGPKGTVDPPPPNWGGFD